MDELEVMTKLVIAFVVGMSIFLAVFTVVSVYDAIFIRPIAAENANEYCRTGGFDQYKSFNRIGVFSREAVAVKCEYAEKYTDLGVRTNG